jgi:hypothetical protein
MAEWFVARRGEVADGDRCMVRRAAPPAASPPAEVIERPACVRCISVGDADSILQGSIFVSLDFRGRKVHVILGNIRGGCGC